MQLYRNYEYILILLKFGITSENFESIFILVDA